MLLSSYFSLLAIFHPHHAVQVLKALADRDHPYSKFSTGNLKTLKDDVPEVTAVKKRMCQSVYVAVPNIPSVNCSVERGPTRRKS